MKKQVKSELNKLVKKILGKPMTKEQLAFQNVLRAKVKAKEITVEEAHRIWSRKYGEVVEDG
jgi:hypothetical protein